MKPERKVALVHDFLLSWGGAERVLCEMAAMYPDAPIYTLLADPEIVQRYFPGKIIHQSFLKKAPGFLRRRWWWLLPFFPVAIETFDLRDYELVLSSSGAWSKGVITRLHTKHVAYVHSPMRFVWDSFHWYPLLRGKRKFFRRIFLSYLRLWDKEASARPDVLIANSLFTQRRVQKYYRREATVVYPPMTLSFPVLEPGSREYFLVVSRLTAAKGIDVVLETFQKLDLPLVVVGDGRELTRLKKSAGPTITFAGSVSEQKLSEYYQGARALIQPTAEDFGLVLVEALAHGTPGIALEEGGAREILEPGKTGEFFFVATPEVIADGVRRFLEHESLYDRKVLQEKARTFHREVFRQKLEECIQREAL